MSFNIARITFGAFLAYFVMSAIISPLGILTGPIAEHYGVTITAATSNFGFLTVGIVVGTLLAIKIFDFLTLKFVVAASGVTICFAIAAIYLVDVFGLFGVWLFVIGTCCGLNLSAAAIIITQTYPERLRASMLLLTDSFYSIAGIGSTFLAGMFIAAQTHWASAYLLAFGAAAVLTSIAAFSSYASTSSSVESVDSASPNWPVEIHLISVAIFAYLVGFVTIYSWVPNYAQSVFGAGVEESGQLVSRMFAGMFIGQLITFFLAQRIQLRNLLLVYCLITVGLTVLLWTVQSITLLQYAITLFGLIGGGVFKVLLAYGTTLVRSQNPKIVSYLVFSSALGSAVSPVVSAFVVESTNAGGALVFATICYTVTMIFFVACRRMVGTGIAIPATT